MLSLQQGDIVTILTEKTYKKVLTNEHEKYDHDHDIGRGITSFFVFVGGSSKNKTNGDLSKMCVSICLHLYMCLSLTSITHVFVFVW